MNKTSAYPLAYGLKSAALPLITVSVKGKSLCFLLDTGSTSNLLDKRVCEYFKRELTYIPPVEHMGIEGNKISSERVYFDFSFEEIVYRSTFATLDLSSAFDKVEADSGIQIHGILGNEFFIENEWIIDFEKLQVITSKRR